MRILMAILGGLITALMAVSFIGFCVSVITWDIESSMICGLVFSFLAWAGVLLTDLEG
jgi:hypothetical protein